MVKVRQRSTPQQEQAAEEFAAKAEQPDSSEYEIHPVQQSAAGQGLPAWKRRNKEPKTSGANIRVSRSQLELLRRAAEAEEISQQKLIENILWPVLEERYGDK
jgi:predicted DNA binding CopG/RHH family protein